MFVLRLMVAALAFVMLSAATRPAHAQKHLSGKARKALYLVARKDCKRAVPLLEEAELEEHHAELSLALADCYASAGMLLEAREIFAGLIEEKIKPRTPWGDRDAIRKSKARLKKIDARLPTLAFETPKSYEDLKVFINGDTVSAPLKPTRYAPNVLLRVVVRAKNHAELREDIVLNEGERMVRPLVLEPQAPKPPLEAKTKKAKPKPKPKPNPPPEPGRNWIGARFRGYLIPKPMWSLFGDGGRTVLVPGGAISYGSDSPNGITTVTLGYASYRLSETPFKSRGTPDTDYEIFESDLRALALTLEYVWRAPLNAKHTWEMSYGGGIGVGWMFAGNLTRTQAYPRDLVPGDPYAYAKCNGPNDPAGTFRYCNQLDHDANHYNRAEPSWFQGGKRPLLYPWLAFPQFGITHYASDDVAIDMEVGLTISGLLVGMGIRVVP